MGPYIRIGLRYVAGILVAKAILPPDVADMIANDPEIAGAVGIGLAMLVEGVYAMARKFGWAK